VNFAVIVNINELRGRSRPLIISRDFSDRQLKVGSQISALPEPVHAELTLRVSGQELFVEGNLAAKVAFTCCRCLAQFERDVEKQFSLSYQPDISKAVDEEEAELNYGELEVGFYHGDEFDLSAVISEQIVLEIPMKPVCRGDCRGLCDQCGTDLNEGDCRCQRRTLDPRFAVLQDFKKRLES